MIVINPLCRFSAGGLLNLALYGHLGRGFPRLDLHTPPGQPRRALSDPAPENLTTERARTATGNPTPTVADIRGHSWTSLASNPPSGSAAAHRRHSDG